MYEIILEAIQQAREQGVRPSKIKMTEKCYSKCIEIARESCISGTIPIITMYGLPVYLDNEVNDFIIM